MIAWMCAALFAVAQVSFAPNQCEVVVDPGGSAQIETTLVVPSLTSYDKVDAYFLADVTGSMGSIIADVVSEARDLAVQAFGSLEDLDLHVGVGRYRDFPNNAFAFDHVLSPTDDGQAVLEAFDSWMALGGSDGAEAQLFALHELATNPDIGWRPGAKRLIFWFGDAPGHDPICTAISGEDAEITELSATADLLAAGPGGSVVLAASVVSGTTFPDALDHDPAPSSGDYFPFCMNPGGLPGQGSRIAAATDGALVETVPTQTAEGLLDAFGQFLRRVRVTLEPTAEIAPFVQSIDPPFVDLTVGAGPGEAQLLPFTVTLAADGCTENAAEFSGRLVAHFDGAPAAGGTKRVTVLQPACDTQCLLLVGFSPLDLPLAQGLPGPADTLHVLPSLMIPVTLESLPVLAVPDDPTLAGVHVYTQVFMGNAFDFPEDPLKLSNAVDFVLGGGATAYGQASGMQCWPQADALLGGSLSVGFSIDGFGP